MPFSLASLYSWSLVRPPGPLCERNPPRRPDEMSSVEVRLDSLASPARARSLLTVRAAISSAVSSLSPRSRSPSLMCSYCRSRLLLQPGCGIVLLPSAHRPTDVVGGHALRTYPSGMSHKQIGWLTCRVH